MLPESLVCGLKVAQSATQEQDQTPRIQLLVRLQDYSSLLV